MTLVKPFPVPYKNMPRYPLRREAALPPLTRPQHFFFFFENTETRIRPRHCADGRASMTSRIFFAHLRPLLDRIYYYIHVRLHARACIYVYVYIFFRFVSFFVLSPTYRF